MVSRFSRLCRRLVVLAAALSLLYSQLALASYVCPMEADLALMAEMMAAGEPCAGQDTQQPALCHQYAADPGQTFEAAKLPTASLPAVVLVLLLPPSLDGDAASSLPLAAAPEARPPPDPLFLSTLRLRV